jgi:hypothetical protein
MAGYQLVVICRKEWNSKGEDGMKVEDGMKGEDGR